MIYINSAQKYIDDVLKFIGITPDVDISGDEATKLVEVSIEGNNLNFLIGYRGESLNALQTLLALALFKEFNEWVNVVVDVNGYKDTRREKIEEITKNFIDRVRFFGKEVRMPVMSAAERRMVHVFVDGYADIGSESEGNPPYRRVILKPL